MTELRLHVPEDPDPGRAFRSRRGRPSLYREPVDPTPPDATYRLSLWDHDDQRWAPEFEGLTKWGLRAAVRAAEDRGYSSVSYLVERE